jgi:alanyl-tRNA synthetase
MVKEMEMSTRKLYHDDPPRCAFTAQVLSSAPAEGGWDVILDQTCFYPTAGGQPHDTGILGGQPIVAVTETENGQIVHHTAHPLSGLVEGEIDWERRFDHMQQHTGQHLLSGAFERLFDVETASWHLGESSCTVDLTMESLSPEQVSAIEWECNRVIQSGLPIRTYVVDQAGLSDLPLRKPPKVTEDIRIVEIAGYDWSACAGTHVSNMSQLSMIKVKSWERNKKQTRVEFLVGDRALSDYRFLDQTTRELCRTLSIGVLDLPGFIDRSQVEISGLRKQVKQLQERFIEIEAAELVAAARRIGGARVVRTTFGGRSIEELRILAAKVAAHPGTAALFGTKGAIPQLLFHRSVDLRIDIGKILREVLPFIDGRGGGSPVQAQGGGSRPDALEQALDAAVRLVGEAL